MHEMNLWRYVFRDYDPLPCWERTHNGGLKTSRRFRKFQNTLRNLSTVSEGLWGSQREFKGFPKAFMGFQRVSGSFPKFVNTALEPSKCSLKSIETNLESLGIHITSLKDPRNHLKRNCEALKYLWYSPKFVLNALETSWAALKRLPSENFPEIPKLTWSPLESFSYELSGNFLDTLWAPFPRN